jgi:hypothetical protein
MVFEEKFIEVILEVKIGRALFREFINKFLFIEYDSVSDNGFIDGDEEG